MTAEVRATIGEVLAPSRLASALVACAGFPRPAETVGPLPPTARLLDLDRPQTPPFPVEAVTSSSLPAGAVPEVSAQEGTGPSPSLVDGVAVIVRTPADLRRVAAGTLRLPSARLLVVHVVEAPQWHGPPSPVAGTGFATRALDSLRLAAHGESGWIAEARFRVPVPVAAVLTSMAGAPVPRAGERPSRPPLSVDELVVNPAGFSAAPELGVADLVRRADGWEVVLDGGPVTAFPGRVTDVDVARLRPLRAVRVEWADGEPDPVDVVVALAAAGVPLLTSRIPAEARSALGEETARLIGASSPELLSDDLRREEHSIELRRTALLAHGRRAPARPPEVSVLLATRRPEMLGFALSQIARQRLVDVEVVLAAHGFSPGDVSGAGPYPVTVVETDATTPFGEVLNLAAARAGGDYLAKWDDDDWYGPHHLADLHLARLCTGAEVTGTPAELFYLQEADTTVRHRWAGETWQPFVAGGTIFMPRDVFGAVGGFRPIPRTVDGQILQAVRQAGGRIYQTHGLGFMMRRGEPGRHTWQEPAEWFLERAVERWDGFRPTATLTG
ncbi:glycosyltransferase family 2 protein [Planomonospora sp. ID67723]|uniref:glycosyltransferase n=1 Tax=Planomonospora sp. ID67723 TaxID=2738134 RepID=UPI0018C3DCEA|nr:glycosyltransferase family 2 protein [Planomonospora sp. ID67723]MBG0828305.1 glycosyltransferase family 2 protein [Planomonospora sp. ID67723]